MKQFKIILIALLLIILIAFCWSYQQASSSVAQQMREQFNATQTAIYRGN